MAKVQIDEELFFYLVRYHCVEIQNDEYTNEYIKQELEKKLNKMCNRLEYSKKLKSSPWWFRHHRHGGVFLLQTRLGILTGVFIPVTIVENWHIFCSEGVNPTH